MKTTWVLLTAVFLGFASLAVADASKIKQLSAELEMKDVHQTVFTPGPLEAGKSVTLTFKNDAVVRVTALSIQENIVRIKAQILRSDDGSELYNATFITRYNSETDISEKTPSGDLIYRLKINPQVDEHR